MEGIFDFKHTMTKIISDLHTDMISIEIKNLNETIGDSVPTFRESIYISIIASRKDCTATDLVRILGVSKAVVSQTIALLENKKLITRTKDPMDSRKHILRIVPEKARDYIDGIRKIDKAVEMSLENYSEEEQDLAMRILSDINKNLATVDTMTVDKE